MSGDHGARIAASHGIARSTQWPEVCRAHLAKQPACVACSRPGTRVEVHHVFLFHLCVRLGQADLEFDERNLVTLYAERDARGAGNHHLLLGHFDDWESMNLHVRTDARARFYGMTAVQLRASAEWRRLVARRTGPLTDDVDALRASMNRLIPKRL